MAIEVKFCTTKRTNVPVCPANFDLNQCTPLRGETPDFWPVSKFNTGSLPLRGVITKRRLTTQNRSTTLLERTRKRNKVTGEEVTRSNIVTSLDSPSLYGEFCRLHRGLRSPSDSILITALHYAQARSLPSAAVRPSVCHVRLFYPDGYIYRQTSLALSF